ncbi:MAG: hypothetical protein HRU35_07590 [Rickettsiaceae bacterium]|nr:hypothetical protein [Rickettsiaceae bacterium]
MVVEKDINLITNLIQVIVVNADVIEHSGKTVLDHLIGTYIILDELEASETLKLAGAFHNIYDTEKFKLGIKDSIKRNCFIDKIGIEPENIICLFSNLIWSNFMKSPPDKFRTNYDFYFKKYQEVGHFHFEQVVLLFFGNIIEQIDIIPYEKRKFFRSLSFKYQHFMTAVQSIKIKDALSENDCNNFKELI